MVQINEYTRRDHPNGSGDTQMVVYDRSGEEFCVTLTPEGYQEALRFMERQSFDLPGLIPWFAFPGDLVSYGVAERLVTHIQSVSALIKEGHFGSIGPLSRGLLESGFRTTGAFLTDDPWEFYMSLLRGGRLSDFKDKSGKKMTDSHMARSSDKVYKGVYRLYVKLCSDVHLDGTLIDRILSRHPDSADLASLQPKDFKISIPEYIPPFDKGAEIFCDFYTSVLFAISSVLDYGYIKLNPANAAYFRQTPP